MEYRLTNRVILNIVLHSVHSVVEREAASDLCIIHKFTNTM